VKETAEYLRRRKLLRKEPLATREKGNWRKMKISYPKNARDSNGGSISVSLALSLLLMVLLPHSSHSLSSCVCKSQSLINCHIQQNKYINIKITTKLLTNKPLNDTENI
jgi:hypothetical protein